MKSAREQVKNFLNKCEQLKKSKFIMATTRIKDLLKCIVNSPALYELFQAATSRFDYVSAKRRCFITSHEGFYNRGHLVLPDSKGERLAFIFCLLVEFDHDSINFNEFLLKYFPEDGGYYASFRSFCNIVINSMEDILREVFSEELGLDSHTVQPQAQPSSQSPLNTYGSAPRMQSPASPSVNYYGPASYEVRPANNNAVGQNFIQQQYAAPSGAYPPEQQYGGQADDAYGMAKACVPARQFVPADVYGQAQQPVQQTYGAADSFGPAVYATENDIYSPLPTQTVTSFGIAVPVPPARTNPAQPPYGAAPWLQSAPVQGVNVYGNMQPRPVPGAASGEKLSAISMLIAYERDIIDRSLMPENEKQDGISILGELEVAVRESRPRAVYALLRGYEYYSACHNNFSQLSIMIRATLGG